MLNRRIDPCATVHGVGAVAAVPFTAQRAAGHQAHRHRRLSAQRALWVKELIDYSHSGSRTSASPPTATNTRSNGSRPSAARSPSRAASCDAIKNEPRRHRRWSPPCSTRRNCRSTTCRITRRSLQPQSDPGRQDHRRSRPTSFRRSRSSSTDQNQILLTSYSLDRQLRHLRTKNRRQGHRRPQGSEDQRRRGRTRSTSSRSARSASLGSLLTYANHDQDRRRPTAAIIWPEATITFKIAEVAPNYLETDFGTGVNKSLTVNTDVWKSLPAEVQKRDQGDRARSIATRSRKTRSTIADAVDEEVQGRRAARSSTLSNAEQTQMGDEDAQHRAEPGQGRRGKAKAIRPQDSSPPIWTRCAPPAKSRRAIGTRT